MNIGDKLLCKKSLKIDLGIKDKHTNYDPNYDELIKDKSYLITKIGEKHIMIFCTKHHQPFSTIRCDVSPWLLYDYFYTPQEIRKLKLEKLKRLKSINI